MRIASTTTRADPVRALALLRRWGWNATGFQVLKPGFRYFFDGDACVAYHDTGDAWVAAGAPIAPPQRFYEVTRKFVSLAHRLRRRVCFFGVEQRFVEAVDLPALLVGEQASWNPQLWETVLAARRSVREQLGRARAKGVRTRLLTAAEMSCATSSLRRAVEDLTRRWLSTRRLPPMGFLVDVKLFDFAEDRRHFAAELDGKLVGFLSAVPVFARRGWLFEDLLRDPGAPNGTTELLVDHGMRAVADEGSSYVTLGLAPLAGPVPRPLQQLRHLASPLYNFDGLQAYKSKLAPHAWNPISLAYAPQSTPALALYDSVVAFAHGSLLEFGLRTLRRALDANRRGGDIRSEHATRLAKWTALRDSS